MRSVRIFALLRPRQVLPLILALSLGSAVPTLARAGTADQIASVVAKVSPSVVGIVVTRPPTTGEDGSDPKMVSASSDKPTVAVGSGFIIDPSGFVATNKHVVLGATAISVVAADGVRYKATVVGMPSKVDMALLHIDARRPLPAVQFGNSDKMRAGDTVIAIGSPFGLDSTVTAGILSAVNRDIMESPFDDYLQTDAAINHGNSGGPLFNLAGEVIGMNSIIIAPGTGSVGLGFALPSSDLQFVFDRLIKTGHVKAGMLPVYTQPVTWMLHQAFATPDLHGALISYVHDDDGQMMHGQIKAGDVILSFNGQKISDPRDLARKAAWAPIGSDATLEICRHGVHENVHVTIHEWPEDKLALPLDDARKPLGLELAMVRGANDQPAVAVASVDPAGTAADGGFQKDDIIVAVQETSIRDPEQVLQALSAQAAQKRHVAAVLVERDKKLTWMPLAVPE
ncbi:MAG TPA: trypsin-like peptidase domain-containing protein [Rhodopila sp.]|jgi:serine protease Do